MSLNINLLPVLTLDLYGWGKVATVCIVDKGLRITLWKVKESNNCKKDLFVKQLALSGSHGPSQTVSLTKKEVYIPNIATSKFHYVMDVFHSGTSLSILMWNLS